MPEKTDKKLCAFRLSAEARKILAKLSKKTGMTMTEVVERALKTYATKRGLKK